MQSGDYRLNITARDQASREVERLRAQIISLNDAIKNLNQSNMGGSSNFMGALNRQLGETQEKLKALTSGLVQQYGAIENFNIRAVAAMRGQAAAIQGEARELSARDAILRTNTRSGQIFTQSVKDATAALTVNEASARQHVARQRDLEHAFGNSVFSPNTAQAVARAAPIQARASNIVNAAEIERSVQGSRALNTEVRHLVALFDELGRGQRGAMFSTIGAGLRDAGLGARVLVPSVAALAAIMAGGAIIRGAEHMGALARNIQAGAEAVGMSVQQFSTFQGVMLQLGMKADEADGILRHLAMTITTAINQPSSQAAQAFNNMGISLTQLRATGGDVMSVLRLLMDAHTHLAADTNRAANEEVIFGRNLQHILPLLSQGQAGFNALAAEARKLGLELSDGDTKALKEVGEEIDHLSARIHGGAIRAFVDWNVAISGVTKTLEHLTDVAGKVMSVIPGAISNIKEYLTGPGLSDGELYLKKFGMNPKAEESWPEFGGSPDREGKAFGPPKPAAGSLHTAVREMQAAQDRIIEQGAKASGGGGDHSAIRQRVLVAEMAQIQKEKQNIALTNEEKTQLDREYNQKVISLNESRATSGIKAAKEDYQAYAAEAKNKIAIETGNQQKQLAILAEWKQKAAETYKGNAAQYAIAMAAIERVSIQISKRTVDQLMHGVHDQMSMASSAVREFEYDMEAMVKLKKLTPKEAFGWNIDKIAIEAEQVKAKINEILNRPDRTPEEDSSAKRMLKREDLHERADIAVQNEKIEADARTQADRYVRPFKTAFDQLGNSLENALSQALSRTAQKGQLVRSLATSIGKSILEIGGDVAGKGIAKQLGAQGDQQLGSFLADKLGSLIKGGASDATKAATDAAVITTPIVAAIESGAIATVAAISVNTANPEIFGFKLAGGGVIPSAAGGMVGGGSRGTMAILHPREMVLPANISDHVINSMGQGAVNNNSGGNMNLTYSPTMNGGGAFQSRSDAERFFRRHSDVMFGMARAAVRSGWRAA